MSLGKNIQKVVQKLLRQIFQLSRVITKALMNWLLRSFLILGRRSRLSRAAGFVLPTVIMVILVVALLTTAIVFRSFDRAKNARNYRVDQVALAAAGPSIERTKAKLDALFSDARLPRSTPSDASLYNLLANDDSKFTFPGEERLKVAYDMNKDKSIADESAGVEDAETISTAWRFPIDTNNNGKFDSFTLYSIAFRSPSQNTDGTFKRARTPLDARMRPMDDGEGSGVCQAALTTSAKLVSSAGWYKSGSKLKKSFFVYTVTVPITDLGTLDTTKYESFQGSGGFSALEYQQDRARVPLSNNAIVFEDDLGVAAGANFYLNGRIVTNSNLFVTSGTAGDGSTASIQLYQVSSPKSCFYEAENSKVIVGGNVVNATAVAANYSGSKSLTVDLFATGATPTGKTFDTTTQSAKSAEVPAQVLYNGQAYTNRINYLVTKWIATDATGANDPTSVKQQVSDPTYPKTRAEALTAYFKDRVRRVPFKEVPYSPPGTATSDTMKDPVGTGDSLRPPLAWMFALDPTDGVSAGSYAKVDLNISGTNVQPPGTEPITLKNSDKENYLGDRMQIGNNLPAVWYKIPDYSAYASDNTGVWVTSKQTQALKDTKWDLVDPSKSSVSKDAPRTRTTQVQSLSEVGEKGRDGFWEITAAQQPKNDLDGVGGLRVVTGAGVYERKNSFLPQPYYIDPNDATTVYTTFNDPSTPSVSEKFPIVWPDTMPMSPAGVEVTDPATYKVAAPAALTFADNATFNDFGGTGKGTLATIPPSPLSTPPLAPGGTLPAALIPTIDPNTPKFAKGDLRMRATAVYHYATDIYDPSSKDYYQEPIACVSSYYDPTDKLTSQNFKGLGYNEEPSGKGRSNNGVSYGPPKTTGKTLGGVTAPDSATGLFPGTESDTDLLKQLYYQANLVFPNGRFANEPLRKALIAKAGGKDLTLSEQSAIDSTICALEILKGKSPDATVIPHGAVQEKAFLDARQIKAIDKDDTGTKAVETFTTLGDANLTGDYKLELEERQPLEVRATQIDLDLLRKQPITFSGGITGPSPEYLLPNSGIIYATRDDALPDLSDRLTVALTDTPAIIAQKKAQQLLNSPVDFKLDPTRRPSGIMLINGGKLGRADKEEFRDVEKGLILATNLPAYVWKDFNPHTQQEFTDALALPSWSNFYTRSTPNDNFACRKSDPRLPNCTTGDTWRPATVISDSITLLSNNYQFGFRSDGDYDLRNNQGDLNSINKRQQNGFFANNYVTSRDFKDSDYSTEGGTLPATSPNSSYFNNFATPIQRRLNAPEYVMEICRKLPVSECGPDDWVVGTTTARPPDTSPDPNLKAGKLFPSGAAVGATSSYLADDLLSGTTAKAATNVADQRFARRVAFLRDTTTNKLILGGPLSKPIPIGINSSGQVQQYPYKTSYTSSDLPRIATNNNGLWFRGTSDPSNPTDFAKASYKGGPLFYVVGTNPLTGLPAPLTGTTADEQPLLVPVLQLYATSAPDTYDGIFAGATTAEKTNWQQKATDTTFNLVVASGNTPARNTGTVTEADGGVANYPRFLENWNGINSKISGSLMEFGRSTYSTGPFVSLLLPTPTSPPLGGLFNYPTKYNTGNNNGQTPFSNAPNRQWGYDVGLLSQIPDLFAGKFTAPPAGEPNEFLRQVNRDDEWVSALLCAKVGGTSAATSSTAFKTLPNAITDDKQRPKEFCTAKTDL